MNGVLILTRVSAGTALALLLAGCAYDHAQHTDRVAFSAGNAVRANLESETINPTKASQYDTTGLGRNGAVVPPADPVVQP